MYFIPLTPIGSTCLEWAATDESLTEYRLQGDSRLQARSRGVRDPGQANPPDLATICFSRNQYQSLADRTAPALTRLWPADEGLVDLHHPGQTLPACPHHCPAQLVQPVPSRPITTETQYPLHTQSAGSQLLVGDIPNGLKPQSQGFMRVGKERTRRNGKVVPALAAAVKWRLHRPNLHVRTIRTAHPVRPSQPLKVLAARGLRGEPVTQFHDRSRVISHAR